MEVDNIVSFHRWGCWVQKPSPQKLDGCLHRTFSRTKKNSDRMSSDIGERVLRYCRDQQEIQLSQFID